MSAAGQWQWLHDRGHDVPAKQVGPGDLLFYANNPHDPATIHHLAMAIGNGRMVEAPTPGIPVRVVPVRWAGLFAAARPVT
jgi:cell wall-associated NlpC family hydrolase